MSTPLPPGLALEDRVLRIALPEASAFAYDCLSDAVCNDVELIKIDGGFDDPASGRRPLCVLLLTGGKPRFPRARAIHIAGSGIRRDDYVGALAPYGGVVFLSLDLQDMKFLVSDLDLSARPLLRELWVPLTSGGACQRAAVKRALGGSIGVVVRYHHRRDNVVGWTNGPPEAGEECPVTSAFERLFPAPLVPTPPPAPKNMSTLARTGSTVTLSDSTEALGDDPATYTFIGVAEPEAFPPCNRPLPPVFQDLPDMPALRGLSLAYRRVDMDMLLSILLKAPNLEFLDVRGALRMDGMEILVANRRQIPRLRELWVTDDVMQCDELKTELAVCALCIWQWASAAWDHPPPEASMRGKQSFGESMAHTAFRSRFADPAIRPRLGGTPAVTVYGRQTMADPWTDVGITVLSSDRTTDRIDAILKAACQPEEVRLVFTWVVHDLEVMRSLLRHLSTSWLASRGDPELVFVLPDVAPVPRVDTLALLAQRGPDAHVVLEMAGRRVSLTDACAWMLAPLLSGAQPPAPGDVDYGEILAADTSRLSQAALALYAWVRYSTHGSAPADDSMPALPRANRLQRREPEPAESGSSGEFSESEASDSDYDPPGPERMDFTDDAEAATPPASPEPMRNWPPTAPRKRSFLASLFW